MCGSDWEILSCGARSGDMDFETCSLESLEIVGEGLGGPALPQEPGVETTPCAGMEAASAAPAQEELEGRSAAEAEAPDPEWEAAARALVAAAVAGGGVGNPVAEELVAETVQLMRAWGERMARQLRAEADAKVTQASKAVEGLKGRLEEPKAREGTQVSCIELSGFRRRALNTRYYPNTALLVNGRETYWTASGELVLYLSRRRNYWGIADAKDYDKIVAAKGVVGFAGKWNSNLLSPRGWEEWFIQDSYFVSLPNEKDIRQKVHWCVPPVESP